MCRDVVRVPDLGGDRRSTGPNLDQIVHKFVPIFLDVVNIGLNILSIYFLSEAAVAALMTEVGVVTEVTLIDCM